ncbi:unnamed protein product [Sphagnum compactum]
MGIGNGDCSGPKKEVRIVERTTVRLALPSKGRMAEDTLALLKGFESAVTLTRPRVCSLSGGAPEEDIGPNQLLSSFRVNATDPICTWCTGATEMLNHENTLSNTSIAEVCNLNLMSAGTLTEGFDHSDGAIAQLILLLCQSCRANM